MNNGRIRKLDELVVNRIAAGEIIHRPANAIKEMLENSLDAGATNIKITIKDGGLKLLQIQDNGSGISKEDLPILCERFTTSKIRKFEDLQTVSTFGFRGEALASISHVAHLSILTKKVEDNAGWKANYSDGKQIGEAKPTAGNKGTIISVEDLFFNVPMRRRALKSANEEYNKIVDVVTKYAVHNPTVSFVCKKVNANVPEISTLSRSTTVMNIKALFGQQVSKELLRFESEDQELDYKCSGYATSTNYASKRTTMLLFINHRLVDCPPLKKSLENAYSALLPKGSHPFVYVDLEIPPQNIDVNVHPTKSQVHFINEDEIIEHLVDALSIKLSSSNTSKSYDVQTYLPKPMPIAQISNPKFIATFAKPAPKAQVRTDGTTRTLDSFIPITQKSSSPPPPKASASTSRITSTPLKRPAEETPQHTPASTQSMRTPIEKVKSNKNNLTSVRNLRQAVIDNKNEDVARMIKNHTFVGFVDMSKHLALIQHNTQLIMLDYKFFAYELFYQIALNQFGNMAKFELNPPPNIRILIEIALKAEEENILESGGEVSLILEKIVNLLTSKARMLDEYFSITINESGELERLPLLLKDYTPDINAIPTLLMNLGPLVNWEDEQECFDQILKQLALFYTPSKENSEAVRWQIQHVLFQSMVKNLTPSDSLNAITEVTSLQNLYRIFERC
ncbi:DNA mismatch repair protein MutL [Wallemia mellicola]|uniref:DNA mismatch repair protein MutL n=1 Tax=Wallemia mellicola TaxID=1708541 RepID=A0AB38MVR0_9BASI|nr:DNA mismatch repair protein MutL [Wallemia mellicola]TIC64385.1 DNA mismatch repair protein MutL [Wallemia mellicola]